MARYLWSKLKDTTYPELEDIRKALTLADKEKEADRDVRPLQALLMRMVEASPRLRGHILTRRTAITSYDYQLVAHSSEMQEMADAAFRRCRRALRAMLNRHTNIPAYGALAIKLEPIQQNGEWLLKPQRVYLPTEVERSGEDLQEVAVLVTDGSGKITGRLYPHSDGGYWITGVDEDTVNQGGILRSLAFHEKLHLHTRQEWANFNLRVKGILHSTWDEFASDEDIDVAKQAAVGGTKHGAASTSKSIGMEFVQTVSYLGATSYKDFMADLAADGAIAILGQANTTQLPNQGGSRAALQVLQLIRADIHYSDIVRIQNELAPQLLLADYQLNHDQAATDVPWGLRLSLADDADVEKEVRAAAEAIESGIPLKRSEVYERIGYSMPQEGDDVITAPSTGVLPPLPGEVDG